jgi:hypothetical protein
MIPFIVYFDASGRSDDPTIRAVFVSGCISTEAKWLRFDEAWRALLGKHRMARPFRMSKFYAEWLDRPKERAEFVCDAIKIIKRYTRKTFSSGVGLAAHRKTAAERHLPLWVNDPYALCATKVVAQVGRWIKNRDVQKKIAFVFETGDLGQGAFITSLEDARVRINPNFASKADVSPFDAGDLIAWVHARSVGRHLAGKRNDVEEFARAIARQLPGRERWGWHDAAWFATHSPKWPHR